MLMAILLLWAPGSRNGKTKKWELQTALLGFTQLNSTHNGIQLGLALFKIVLQAGIAHKVSHIIIQRRQHEMLRYRLDM